MAQIQLCSCSATAGGSMRPDRPGRAPKAQWMVNWLKRNPDWPKKIVEEL